MRRVDHTNANFVPLEALAEGGMGRVIRARDVRLERVVALKELKPELSDDRDSIRRFVQEARVTAQLQHPSIPPVYELGEYEDGSPFIALQYVEGTTLAGVLARLREGDAELAAEFTLERRVQVMQRVMEALDYAHNHGFIHRDLKPENVMVGAFGEVYVMDWGVAKFFGNQTPGALRNRYSETRAGVFTGTPRYASPEQLSSQEGLSPASDQYSVGAVLYELVTLRPPHDHEDVRQLISRALTESPASPASLGVPPELSAMILRALARDPESRYPDLRAFSHDLQLWVRSQAQPVPLAPERTSRLAWLESWLERHPVLGPGLVYGWGLLPLALLAALLARAG